MSAGLLTGIMTVPTSRDARNFVTHVVTFHTRDRLKLTSATDDLARTLSSERATTRAFGEGVQASLRLRLGELDAVACLADVIESTGLYRELDRDDGRVAVALADGWRMVIRPSDQPPSWTVDGGLNWAMVREVEILAVEAASERGDS